MQVRSELRCYIIAAHASRARMPRRADEGTRRRRQRNKGVLLPQKRQRYAVKPACLFVSEAKSAEKVAVAFKARAFRMRLQAEEARRYAAQRRALLACCCQREREQRVRRRYYS